jgi:hypothetical protein
MYHGDGENHISSGLFESTMTGNRSQSLVLVITPTGITAFNINGLTIHTTLSIPLYNNKSFN